MKTTQGAVAAILLCLAPLAHGQSNTLQFTATRATDEGAIHLEWASQSNHVYQIQCTDTLIDTNTGTTPWQILWDEYPSQGTNTFWLDTGNYFKFPAIVHPSKSPMRFYRVMDKGPDDLVGDEPTITITSPTNGFVASGDLDVSVNATTDQGEVESQLYVDGQMMWPNGDGTNYVINTCEWGNGPHVLFAVARSSTAVDGPASSLGFTGHGVSPMVPVVFSNLISRISFSEPFFKPALGQTQQVSAVFAANCDWTLEIKDIFTNSVRTAAGSGGSMQFAWDGTGDGGTNIPDGMYYYYVSAQTNGQPLQSQITGGGDSGGTNGPPSPSFASAAFSNSTESFVVSDAGSGSAVPLRLYPPGFDTNNLTIVELSPSEASLLMPVDASETSANTPTAGNNAGASPDFAGPSSQAASPTPGRPPATPAKGSGGKFAVAYQLYNANGTNPVPASPILDNNVGLRSFVQMQNNSGTVSLPYAPFRNVDYLVIKFVGEMTKGSWDMSGFKDNDNLKISDLQGSGTFFNDVDLGLLAVHGTYGTSFDSTPGHPVKQMYFPIASGGSAQYLRMSDMNLGGSSSTNGLKWMALLACDSLFQTDWNSMKSQSVKPYNSNLHMILGCGTDFAAEPLIGQFWADYMLGLDPTTSKPQAVMKIRDAWYQAANDAYKKVGPFVSIPNPTVLAVAADSNCSEDFLQTNSPPSESTWNYYNNKTVYPPQ